MNMITPSPFINLTPPNHTVKSPDSFDLQSAFESFDVDQIIRLLDQGADPNQQLEVTLPLQIAVYSNFFRVKYSLSLEEALSTLIDEFDCFDEEEIEKFEKIEGLRETQLDMEAGRAVPEFTVVRILSSLLELEGYDTFPQGSFVSLIYLSLLTCNQTLVEKLVEAGANLNDLHITNGCELPYKPGLFHLDEIPDELLNLYDFLLSNGWPLRNCFGEQLSFKEFQWMMIFPSENASQIFSFLNKHYNLKSFFKSEGPYGGSVFSYVIKKLFLPSKVYDDELMKQILGLFPEYPTLFDEKLNLGFICVQTSTDEPLYKDVFHNANLSTLEEDPSCFPHTDYKKIKALLDAGYKVENIFGSVDSYKRTLNNMFQFALLALVRKDYKTLELLHQEGFDLDHTYEAWGIYTSSRRNLLGYAIKGNKEGYVDLEMCEFLISHGAKVETLPLPLQERWAQLKT